MDEEQQYDPRKIRIGFAILGFVMVVSLFLAGQVDAGGPRVLLTGLAIFTLVRLFLLMRKVRKGQ